MNIKIDTQTYFRILSYLAPVVAIFELSEFIYYVIYSNLPLGFNLTITLIRLTLLFLVFIGLRSEKRTTTFKHIISLYIYLGVIGWIIYLIYHLFNLFI